MTVEYAINSDIFEAKVESLVNPVNCVGVAGAGLARMFREVFPTNFTDYALACRRMEVYTGRIYTYEIKNPDPGGVRWIFNFPTKNHWADKSLLVDVESGLSDLVRIVKDLGVKSIAIPAIGCGLGGLDWNDVKPLVCDAADAMTGVDVMIFSPR